MCRGGGGCGNESDRSDILTIITAFAPFAMNAEKVLTVSKAKAKQKDAYKVDREGVASAQSFRSFAKNLRGEKATEKPAFDLAKELTKLIKKAERESAPAAQLAKLQAVAETLMPQVIEAEPAANVAELKTA